MVSSTHWNRRRASGAHQAEQDKCCRALLPAARHCPVQHSITQQRHAMPRRSVPQRGVWPSHVPPPGCAIGRLGCRIGTFPGPHAALHPLHLPPVFILQPWRIGCRPGREHEESGPQLANQTPPKPGELWGQRLASDLLLPDSSAQYTSSGLLSQGMASPCACAALGWDAARDRRPQRSSVPAQRLG